MAQVAFDLFGPFYDAFTAHHNPDAWIADLLEAAFAHGLAGDRALDVACGTGNSLAPLLRRGWRLTGCDLSPKMLAEAGTKMPHEVVLLRADMRDLPRLGDFDLVTCLDDAVNYLADPAELSTALAGFERNLRPGGVLVFDVNTVATYRTFYVETQVVDGGDYQLIWRGLEEPDFEAGSHAEATFEVRGAGGDLIAGPAVHRQRHFRPTEMQVAMAGAGLQCLDVFGHGLDGVFEQPLDENRHTKAVFIARRSQ